MQDMEIPGVILKDPRFLVAYPARGHMAARYIFNDKMCLGLHAALQHVKEYVNAETKKEPTS